MSDTGTWRARKARKAALRQPNYELGAPTRPRGLPRAARNAWNILVADLLARRVLAKTDSKLLVDLIQARADAYRAGGERREAARRRVAEIEAVFAGRTPFSVQQPEAPAPPSITLAEYLADTAAQRSTFAQRLIPNQTTTLDLVDGRVQPYGWDDPADAAVRARDYAQRVEAGAFPACDLLKRAAARFIADLDHGCEKGLFFDPVQARAIEVWFREFLKMPLEDWQLFVCVNLFGWRLPSGPRRFRDCWLWVARQNGKSQLSAGVGLFVLLADGEDSSQVYSAATTKEQAGIIFRAATRFATTNPELAGAIKKYRNSLTVEQTDSSFQPLASEVATLDGLRPALLAADEIHEWDNAGGREQWAKLTSGMVSRAHPITLAISTSGGKQHGFGWEKYSMVRKILHGIFPAEDVFCCVWELDEGDDYRDRTLWAKANPALLGGHLKIEALQKQFAETEADPSALSSFLRYQCNRWVSFDKNTGSIPLAKWDDCRGYPDLPNFSPKELVEQFLKYNTETPCYVGFDWGEISDLACAALMFPYVRLADGSELTVKALIPFFWMPEDYVQQREREWQVPIATWVREGWINTCAGDMNDAQQVKDEIVEYCSKILMNVRSCGFDPWHSRQIAAAIAEEARIECVEVPQKPSVLTPLAVNFKALIYEKKLWHLGNPVLRWMAGNVQLEREGKYGVIVPTKPDKNRKIDGIQAALSALHRLENAPPPSVYSTRGIVLI